MINEHVVTNHSRTLVILCLLFNIFLYVRVWKIARQVTLPRNPSRIDNIA